jgi:hypothetical protein
MSFGAQLPPHIGLLVIDMLLCLEHSCHQWCGIIYEEAYVVYKAFITSGSLILSLLWN